MRLLKEKLIIYRRGMATRADKKRLDCNARRQARRKFPITEDSKCNRCEGKEKLERHHIDSNPYNNVKSNIEIVCSQCHRILHNGKEKV
jgi:hypothetical protein